MLEIIYSPILSNILPPFQKNSEKEFEINIPFKHSSTLNNNWKGIKVIIYTASGNKIEERIIPRGLDITDNNIRVIIGLTETVDKEIRKYLSMGNFYKIQIKYDFGLENDKYNILNSNLGVIKCTGESVLEILGLDNTNGVSIYYGDKITGKYSNTDITELPYSYKFEIYNNETGSLYVSSGEKLHNSSQDNENNHYDTWSVPKVLEQNQTYKIKYWVKTSNNLEKETEEFIIAPMTIIPEINDFATFIAEPLSAIGGIKVYFKQKPNTGKHSVNGFWEILRRTEKSSWEVMQKIQANLTPLEDFYWIDMTVEQNTEYVYGIREYNDFIYSNLLTTESVFVDFEDIFLFDGKRQLCIRYNPQISNFKNNILEQKTDTIGGKYPYIFRNGQTKYKEFPINGLISIKEENNQMFWDIKIENNEIRENSPSKKIIADNVLGKEFELERKFKIEVLDWLSNGKPKLFRSAQEGNYLVYLSQVNLTPYDGTFRLVHSFQCTAFEIADNSYEELLKYNIYRNDILDLTNLENSKKIQTIDLSEMTDTICVGPKAIARCCTSGESSYKIEDDTFVPLGDNTTINLDLLRAYDYGVTYVSDNPSDDNDVPEEEPETQLNQLVYSAYKCTSGQDTDFWLERASTPYADFYNITIPSAEGSAYKITKKNNLEIQSISVYNQFLIRLKDEVFRYKSPYNALSKSNFNYLVIGCKNISPTPTLGEEPMYYFSYRPNVDFSSIDGKDHYLFAQRTSYKDGKIIVPLTGDFSKNATNADDYKKYENFHIETIRFYPSNARGGILPNDLNIEIEYIGLFEDIKQAENFVYKGEAEIKQVSDKVFSEEELKIASYDITSTNERYSLDFTPQKIFSYGNGKKIDKYSQDIDIEIKNIETIQYADGSKDTVVQYGAKNSNFNYMVSTDVLFDFKQLYEFDNKDSIRISSVDGYQDGFNEPKIIYMRQYKIGNSITSIKYFLIDYTNQGLDFTNYETSDPVSNQATNVKRYWAGILFTIPAKNYTPEDLNKIAKIGTITLNTFGKLYKFPRDNFNSIFSTNKYKAIQLLYSNGYLETLKNKDKNISISNENLNQDIQIKTPIKKINAVRQENNIWKGQQYIQPSNSNVEGIELLPQLSNNKAMYNRYYYSDSLGVLNCKTVSAVKGRAPGWAVVPINNEKALSLTLQDFLPYSRFYLGNEKGESSQEYLVGITGSLTLNNLPKEQEYFLVEDKTLNGYQKGIINYTYNQKAIEDSLGSIASIEYIPTTIQSFPQWDETFDGEEKYDVIDGIKKRMGTNSVLGYIYYIKLEKKSLSGDSFPNPIEYYFQYSFDGKTWNNLKDENGAIKEIKKKIYLDHFYIRPGLMVQCGFDGWKINKRQ